MLNFLFLNLYAIIVEKRGDMLYTCKEAVLEVILSLKVWFVLKIKCGG